MRMGLDTTQWDHRKREAELGPLQVWCDPWRAFHMEIPYWKYLKCNAVGTTGENPVHALNLVHVSIKLVKINISY